MGADLECARQFSQRSRSVGRTELQTLARVVLGAGKGLLDATVPRKTLENPAEAG
jgi:hypothetical protein